MNKFVLVACLVVSAVSASGCAIGREQVFHNRTIQVPPASASIRVAVAVHDRREEVVGGAKSADFVGLSRGGWGNPFDITTASDAALADDMAGSIAQSMQRAGYQVRVIPVAFSEQPAQAAARLSTAGAQRIVLLRLDKWKSDTYNSTALHYDVELLVLDAKGKPIAHAQQRGEDNLGSSFWNPGSHADKAVPLAFEQKIQQLLNDHEVVRALRSEPAPVQSSAAKSGRPRS